MALLITFLFSGAMIVLLLLAKMWERKHDRAFFLLNLISLGDHRVRELSHETAHLYSETKERAIIYFTRQLPLRLKNTFNKTVAFARTKIDAYVGNIRGSKLLKRKNEGISEFFRSISEMEREVSSIEEVFADTSFYDAGTSSDISDEKMPEITRVIIPEMPDITETVTVASEPAPKKPRKRRSKKDTALEVKDESI